MKATTLLALQFASLIAMLITAENLFTNKIATSIFAIGIFLFARTSIYISKNSSRLLKELEKEKH